MDNEHAVGPETQFDDDDEDDDDDLFIIPKSWVRSWARVRGKTVAPCCYQQNRKKCINNRHMDEISRLCSIVVSRLGVFVLSGIWNAYKEKS